MYDGILLINKQHGITSHDAVAIVRKAVRQKSIGHTGTLDPLAEGLIVLCLGRATKVARFVTDYHKSYEAEIYLGLTSKTYDAEGVDPEAIPESIPNLSSDGINRILEGFVGTISQKVPAYSAVRVEGKHLYELARNGEEVHRPERQIEIKEIRLLSYEAPRIKILVTCSKGTYIRSLANDIGERIGCGGYLSSLKRTSVGRFCLEDALEIDDIRRLHESGELQSQLKPIEAVLGFSALKVTDNFSRVVIQGRTLEWDDVLGIEGDFNAGDHVVLKNALGQILAIGKAELDSAAFATRTGDKLFRYERVLN